MKSTHRSLFHSEIQMQRKFLENQRKIVTSSFSSVRGQCYLRAAARMSFINLTAPGASSCIASTCAPSRTFCRICVCVRVRALKYIYDADSNFAYTLVRARAQASNPVHYRPLYKRTVYMREPVHVDRLYVRTNKNMIARAG